MVARLCVNDKLRNTVAAKTMNAEITFFHVNDGTVDSNFYANIAQFVPPLAENISAVLGVVDNGVSVGHVRVNFRVCRDARQSSFSEPR